MQASLMSALPYGLDGRLVEVQVDIGGQAAGFEVVGLAAASVKEARARVRSAIKNSELQFPAHKVTVNLAPATERKEGSSLDLPMAVAVHCALTGQKPPANAAFIGELGLRGEVRHVTGILVAGRALKAHGFTELFVPEADAAEAALIPGVDVYRCQTLRAVSEHIAGRERLALERAGASPSERRRRPPADDLADVQGQQAARRALEVAAAGGHHLLLSGPPGAGKTMLARCLPGILPELTLDEALELAQVRSVLGELPADGPLEWERPFRAPHHGISGAGLIGGGAGVAQPGEISRAHHGVLFLDELAEFQPTALQALRQPLEDGRVSITRSAGSVSYPARFQLVAATNPCPCGWLGDSQHPCRCSTSALSSYSRALSGPLLDRIDLRVTVLRPRLELLAQEAGGEPSAAVRERVVAARGRQLARQGKLNSALRAGELRRHAGVDASLRTTMHRWAAQRGFTARALHRAWRVALTLADLEGVSSASQAHVLEALGYRLQEEVA